jgi:hypothetical protein
MEIHSFVTHATAWAAFFCYIVALMLRLTVEDSRMSRIWWTAGCLMLFVHVACAFQFVHHWSHRAAYEATAQQTEALTGFASGSGVYVNYAVLVVWLSDVCWWWRSPASYESRTLGSQWLLQGFLAFVWFNATVVFGHGTVQWLGSAAWILLIILCWRRRSARFSPRN